MDKHLEFTEVERIEIARRNSEVNSIIKASSRLFSASADLKEQILETRNSQNSYWLWGFGVVGLIIDYMLREKSSGLEFNFGTFIWATVLLTYYRASLKIWELNRDFNKANERLYDLERLWFSAVSVDSFWKMRGYIDELSIFDDRHMSDEAKEWKDEQMFHIINTVSGWESADMFMKNKQQFKYKK